VVNNDEWWEEVVEGELNEMKGKGEKRKGEKNVTNHLCA
jgi:hypothetical protein